MNLWSPGVRSWLEVNLGESVHGKFQNSRVCRLPEAMPEEGRGVGADPAGGLRKSGSQDPEQTGGCEFWGVLGPPQGPPHPRHSQRIILQTPGLGSQVPSKSTRGWVTRIEGSSLGDRRPVPCRHGPKDKPRFVEGRQVGGWSGHGRAGALVAS